MPTGQFLNIFLLGVVAWLSTASLSAQHLNTGALGTNQESQLVFANAADFVNTSGYVGKCVYTNGGTYAGYYQFGLSPTALPATVANGGPVLNAPAVGSFIQMRIESVSGPEGGAFALWEQGATSATVSVIAGSITPSAMFSLSDRFTGAGAAGGDPFGHIHGRRFTLSKAGNYTVGLKVFDTSTNGAAQGPIHTPSDILKVNLATSVALSMKRLQRTNGSTWVTFHQGGITNVLVEAGTDFDSNAWSVIAGPFASAPFGSNSTTTIIDTNAEANFRFYRLRGIAP